MRRLLSFPCEGADLAASLDGIDGTVGVLMVTGGSQTRIGSHRMYERLAKSLSERGFCCLRFDRRGVGDSAGEDPGFKGSAADLSAAAAAFRKEAPALAHVIGFGLCDGATAIALHGKAAGLDGLVLVNPWLVEASEDAPAAAAVRAHYAKRLTSREGWKKILSGAVNWRKLLKGVRSATARDAPSPLANETASALRSGGLRSWLVLAEGDATGIAAAHELESAAFNRLIEGRETVKTDSHTFAREGDEAALLAATMRALKALSH